MKHIYLAIIAVITILGLSACSGEKENTEKTHPAPFKIIAYVTDKKMAEGFLEKQLARVTHINYSFINPSDDASGKIADFNTRNFEAIVEKVKQAKKEIYISLGGWRGDDSGYDLVYEQIAANPQAKKVFINNIMKLVLQYNLDGVDLDWEYPRVEFAEQYADFVIDLAQVLHQENKLLTAAVIGRKEKSTDDGDGAAYLDRAINAFDWINLMAYDDTSTNHSPFKVVQQSIDYWIHERGVPANKAVLGLPFYARPSWRSYQQVIKEDKSQACRDTAIFKDSKDYYNGIPTIVKKTQFAINSGLAGVMVWELLHDSADAKYSLMQTIFSTVNKSSQTNLCQ